MHCVVNLDVEMIFSLINGMLFVLVGSDESLFLLSTCYYRSGKPVKAYMLLQNKGCPNAQCKYLMAQCCMEINK